MGEAKQEEPVSTAQLCEGAAWGPGVDTGLCRTVQREWMDSLGVCKAWWADRVVNVGSCCDELEEERELSHAGLPGDLRAKLHCPLALRRYFNCSHWDRGPNLP